MSHIKVKFETTRQSRGQQRLTGARPEKAPPAPRVPHVAKLMALAIRLEDLLESGQVRDQAELARLGRVSRARLTQIMNLLHLAPDLQEKLLSLPESAEGRDAVFERDLRPIAKVVSWERQRRMWGGMPLQAMTRFPRTRIKPFPGGSAWLHEGEYHGFPVSDGPTT